MDVVVYFRLFVRIRRMLAVGVFFPGVVVAQFSETEGEYAERRARQEARLPAPSRGPGLPDNTYLDYLVTYFPPTPPVFGGVLPELPSVRTVLNGRSLANAPEGLADFVGETFYAVLSSRLFEGDGQPGRKTESRLIAYQSARAALVDELMGELLRLQAAPKKDRAEALRAFALRQAADLATLEREAEELRHDLMHGGFLAKDADWNALRSWRIDDQAIATSPLKVEAEFQVARATAFFQNGLSVEQRGLLREIAMERAWAARVAQGRRPPADADPAAMFFSPETARFRLPVPLPPELLQQIGRFNSEKAALKAELFETLLACEPLASGRRATRFAALASAQKRRIAGLEKEAEEIRVALDASPGAPAPWVPPLPLALHKKIDAYNRDRDTLFASYASAQWMADQAAIRDSGHEEQKHRPAAAARESARRFDAEHAGEIAALRVCFDEIRSELVEIARDLDDPRTNQPLTVASLLDAYRVAMQRFDTIGREEAMYERYKIAMLQPGLSPAQRRLLFRAAHANLAQALPGGEVMLAKATRPSPRS